MLSIPGQFVFASITRAFLLPNGPEVVTELTRRDFGDVFAGEELEQNFPVRNAGNKPLELAEKSRLGVRMAPFEQLTSAAAWRPGEHLVARTVAARPATPG